MTKVTGRRLPGLPQQNATVWQNATADIYLPSPGGPKSKLKLLLGLVPSGAAREPLPSPSSLCPVPAASAQSLQPLGLAGSLVLLGSWSITLISAFTFTRRPSCVCVCIQIPLFLRSPVRSEQDPNGHILVTSAVTLFPNKVTYEALKVRTATCLSSYHGIRPAGASHSARGRAGRRPKGWKLLEELQLQLLGQAWALKPSHDSPGWGLHP